MSTQVATFRPLTYWRALFKPRTASLTG